MTSDAAISQELAFVLAEPAFQRSPVLSRLLTYLVEMTLNGGASKLKSYAVAVDGLGRSPDVDPQVDTYARVQVARLRKALDAVYALPAAVDRWHRLTIDSGSYEVRLVELGRSARPAPPPAAPPAVRTKPQLYSTVIGVLALLAIGIGLIVHWRGEAQAAQARWNAPDFPTFTVRVKDPGASGAASPAELLRQELLLRIGTYQALRIEYDAAAKADYTMDVSLYRAGGKLHANTFVVDRRTNRVVWSSSDIVMGARGDQGFEDAEYVSHTAFTIARATGVIHSNERHRAHPSDTPYGCWLVFATQTPTSYLDRDSELYSCAHDWYEAVPDHPMAASIYAWTLLDQALIAVSDRRRLELIDKAVDTIEHARSVNPSSGLAAAVAIRAYTVANKELALHDAAQQALKLNPGNIEIKGLVGTMLTFRGDPRGEALIDEALAQDPNPAPWFFSAKFIAAMMREDVAGAGAALAKINLINHGQRSVPIFTAAYLARIGKLDKARVEWKQALASQPTVRGDPKMFLQRSPMAPRVNLKLMEWLKPLL